MKINAFVVAAVMGSAVCGLGQETVGDGNAQADISPVDKAIGNVRIDRGVSMYSPYEPLDDGVSYIKIMDPVVNFTEAQKHALAEIFSQRNKELEEVNKKAKAASDMVAQAKDADARNMAVHQMRAAYAPMHAVMKKYNDEVESVFTAEQKRQVQDWQLTSLVKTMAKPVELTEQQVRFVKNAANVGEGNDSYPPMLKALNDVMTAEQKAKFKGSRAVWAVCGTYRAANLTVEQVTTLHTEVEILAKNLSLSQEELAEVLSKKLDGLLTEEQKKAFEPHRKAAQQSVLRGATSVASPPNNPR
jgi:hypothetical protein